MRQGPRSKTEECVCVCVGGVYAHHRTFRNTTTVPMMESSSWPSSYALYTDQGWHWGRGGIWTIFRAHAVLRAPELLLGAPQLTNTTPACSSFTTARCRHNPLYLGLYFHFVFDAPFPLSMTTSAAS